MIRYKDDAPKHVDSLLRKVQEQNITENGTCLKIGQVEVRQQKPLITTELPQSFQVLTQAVLLQTDVYFSASTGLESGEPHRRYKSEPRPLGGPEQPWHNLSRLKQTSHSFVFLQCKAQMKMRTDFMDGFYRHKLVAGRSCERLPQPPSSSSRT